jgi:hypothetical protein
MPCRQDTENTKKINHHSECLKAMFRYELRPVCIGIDRLVHRNNIKKMLTAKAVVAENI